MDNGTGAAGAGDGGCSCCMGVMLGDFGFFLVAVLGGLSRLCMDFGGTAAATAAAAFCGTIEVFSVVDVDASFF